VQDADIDVRIILKGIFKKWERERTGCLLFLFFVPLTLNLYLFHLSASRNYWQFRKSTVKKEMSLIYLLF
jgi:hypothetical protein